MNTIQSTVSGSLGSLLHTKLMPPRVHSTVIPRGDLLNRLDAGLTRKLSLVTAPTGYGKTTLVSLWLEDRNLPFAWLTLDEYDNDPVRFWIYIVSALRTFDPRLGKTALTVLAGSQPIPFQAFLTALINDLGVLHEPSVLVLDDFHTLTSAEILTTFSYLLQHMPGPLHLILIARHEPSLPLGRLRALDDLVELETADLRFSQTEAETFLMRTVGVELSPAALVELQERTQGWAAGLRLAARVLEGKSGADTEQFIQSFSGNHRYVADYLIQEVFEKQPQATQRFLLKTCFLERLTGSLCEAVTGESGGEAALVQLARGELFLVQLEPGAGRSWYRYNPMFAASIQYLARQRLSDQEVRSSFDKAGEWYAAHGLYEDAVESALSAGLFERAMGWIEKFIEIHDLSELHTLERWLKRIPDEEIVLHPVLCFTYAQIILYGSTARFEPGTSRRMEPYLGAAERIWRERGDHQQLGELLSLRGIAAWWQGELQKAFEFAQQSLDELPDFDLLWRGNSLLILSIYALNAGRILEAQDIILEARALLGAAQNIYGVLAAIQELSEAFYWQGEMDQAEQLNQQILNEAVGDESMLDDQGIASLGLAGIAHERNELNQAEQYAGRALDLARQRGNYMVEVRAVVRLAFIDAARGDFQRAGEALKSLVPGIHNPTVLREIQAAQTLVSVQSGDLASLSGWQVHLEDEKNPVTAVQSEQEAFILARILIAEGKASQALEVLNARAMLAATHGRVRSQVTALCLEALARYALGNPAQAVKPLTEALAVGQDKGFRRLFLDEGLRFAVLLQALLPSLTQRKLALYAATLLHSFDPAAGVGSSAMTLAEPLSQQELRVLRLLAAGMSYGEIASELVISGNTVKTHVKSIYRKLNVSSRAEARQVAHELKLL